MNKVSENDNPCSILYSCLSPFPSKWTRYIDKLEEFKIKDDTPTLRAHLL